MKCSLKYIAIIDNSDQLHFVDFAPGLNVITGKSSTGKSAMIEIFDYCFGSSDFTVPVGIITDNAKIYFIIIALKSTYLVLARDNSGSKAYLKEITTLPDIKEFNSQYFDEKSFINLPNFKVELGRYFGIDIYDTDTDYEDRNFRPNSAKKARPSVRNFTPFMLQHQGLIANKHSLFYRFDEKEKREQTIDQFKIFMGFVTQEYFIKSQKLNDLDRELKGLRNKQKNIEEDQEKQKKNLLDLLKEFQNITGKSLMSDKVESIFANPANFLSKIENYKIVADINSKSFAIEFDELNKNKNLLLSAKRKLQLKISEINSSISYAEKYKEVTEGTVTIKEVNIHNSQCPFCNSFHKDLVQEANSLYTAINWLNDELSKTPYLLDSFLSEQKELENKVKDIDILLVENSLKIEKINQSIKRLDLDKSLDEQGLKTKLKIENFIENYMENNPLNLVEEISKKENELNKLRKEIEEIFDPKHMKRAETYINQEMKKIGSFFDFEDSYKPINLKFSLDSFELWHEKDNKKIYLRSMGSGANWLYCHLTLFFSLHKYFCSLKNKCLIPSILFLDQPSQVYFPAAIDNEEEFDAKKLKEKEGKLKTLDEDLLAVTNLYQQIFDFCKNTLSETGIEPQIIITDHADNLTLKKVEFQSLVRSRWRKRGFIEIKKGNSKT